MKKARNYFLFLYALALMVLARQTASSATRPDATPSGASPSSTTLSVTLPHRVVSLLPSHSEIAVALGAGDSLVGVSDGERPEDFPSIPRVGGVSPRWEPLVALAPDLILADSCHQRFASDFQRYHLPVRFFPSTHAKTIEDVFRLIDQVGRDLNRSLAAQALVNELKTRLAKREAKPSVSRAPTAFFEIWPHPLQAVGPDSLQGNLLARAGFRNIVPDTHNEMPLISAEWVVGQRPEYLFYTGRSSEIIITHRSGWNKIPAVVNGQVVLLDADLFSRAGPHIVDALDQLIGIRR